MLSVEIHLHGGNTGFRLYHQIFRMELKLLKILYLGINKKLWLCSLNL